MKKALWVLNVDNYSPDITVITYPLLKAYAKKIRAEFCEITTRKYPAWPVVCEKMQIYDLAREAVPSGTSISIATPSYIPRLLTGPCTCPKIR